MADARKAELVWSSTADEINKRNRAYNVSRLTITSTIMNYFYYKAEWARSLQQLSEKK